TGPRRWLSASEFQGQSTVGFSCSDAGNFTLLQRPGRYRSSVLGLSRLNSQNARSTSNLNPPNTIVPSERINTAKVNLMTVRYAKY
ncbi:MAG: hypothetical protein ACRD8U_04025, partial [Pyrinomonadaceae bacterium]